MQHERGPRKPKNRPLEGNHVFGTSSATITPATRPYGAIRNSRQQQGHGGSSRRLLGSRISNLRAIRCNQPSTNNNFVQCSDSPASSNSCAELSTAAHNNQQQIVRQPNIGPFHTGLTSPSCGAQSSGTSSFRRIIDTSEMSKPFDQPQPFSRMGFESIGKPALGGPMYHGSSPLSTPFTAPLEKPNFNRNFTRRSSTVHNNLVAIETDSEESNEDDVIIDVEAVEGPSRTGNLSMPFSTSSVSALTQGRLNNLLLSHSQNILARVAAATDQLSTKTNLPTVDQRASESIVDSQVYKNQLLQNPLLASYISHYLMSPCLPSIPPIECPTMSRPVTSSAMPLINATLIGQREQLPYWHLASSYLTSNQTPTSILSSRGTGHDLTALNREKNI